MGRQDRPADPVYRAGRAVENCYCESFNGKFREECLRQEIF